MGQSSEESKGAHLSLNSFLKNKNSLKGQVPYMCTSGTGIKRSGLSQDYILISIFIFSVCVSVQHCTHCGDWRTALRSHFPPDALWDPGTKLRLTGLCTGTGTQQATLLAPS